MEDRPEAIIITMSQQTIKDRPGGYKRIMEEWMGSNGDTIWNYRCINPPVHPVSIIYWVIAGRIRWQCRLVSVQKVKRRHSSDVFRKRIYAMAWLELIDFEAIPRQIQPAMKGFQGFRYSPILF